MFEVLGWKQQKGHRMCAGGGQHQAECCDVSIARRWHFTAFCPLEGHPSPEMLNTDASILNSIFFWEKKKITWHFLGGPLVSSEGKVAATQHKSTPSDNLSSMMTHSFGRREGSLTGCHILIHRAREVAKWFNEYKHNVNHALRALWTQLWDHCASVTTKETSS